MYLYVITHRDSDSLYIGITVNPDRRVATHAWSSRNKKTPLYDWMEKYPDWVMEVACEYDTLEEAFADEIFWIHFGRKNGWKLLNLADGGNGGYTIPDSKRRDWKKKLSTARQGRKPALGMKHTDENKKLFSEVSRAYWETKGTYDSVEVCAYPFKEANKLFGISKTHYYRLKRTLSNDQC